MQELFKKLNSIDVGKLLKGGLKGGMQAHPKEPQINHPSWMKYCFV